MSTDKKQTWLANILILLSVVGRLIPHPSNFTPVGGMALVGGAKLNRIWRWTIPFIAMALGDALLYLFYGFEPWSLVTFFIYGSIAINIWLGRFVQGNQRTLKLCGLSVVGGLQFFVLSNFGTWIFGGLYPATWEGLTQCYLLALPFLQGTIMGDLVWSLALFTAIERSQVWLTKRHMQTA